MMEISKTISLYMVNSLEDVKDVMAASEADNHYCLSPTHFFKKNNKIVGYYSNGAIPVTHFWADRKNLTPRESYNMISACIHIARSTLKSPIGIVCCAKTSPFYPHLEEHFNMRRLLTTDLFIKDLR